LIGSNFLGEIRFRLKGHPCQAHGTNMRVHVEATGYQAYPDVSVVCPPVEGDTEHTKTKEGFWLLLEIIGTEQSIRLESLAGAILKLSDIYDKVEFPA
jgi:hypothetical protein